MSPFIKGRAEKEKAVRKDTDFEYFLNLGGGANTDRQDTDNNGGYSPMRERLDSSYTMTEDNNTNEELNNLNKDLFKLTTELEQIKKLIFNEHY